MHVYSNCRYSVILCEKHRCKAILPRWCVLKCVFVYGTLRYWVRNCVLAAKVCILRQWPKVTSNWVQHVQTRPNEICFMYNYHAILNDCKLCSAKLCTLYISIHLGTIFSLFLIAYALAKWLYPCDHSVPSIIFYFKSLLVPGNRTYLSDIFTKHS